MTENRNPLVASEDWWAVWLAGLLIASVVLQLITGVPSVGRWSITLTDAFAGRAAGLLALGFGLLALTALAIQVMTREGARQATAFAPLFALAVLAHTFANQVGIRAAGFGYAFWALLIGLAIANTIGTPTWLRPALRSELYIKTGLVLLGRHDLHVPIRDPRFEDNEPVAGNRYRRRDISMRRVGCDCGGCRRAREEGRTHSRGWNVAHLHRRYDGADANGNPRIRHGSRGRCGMDRRDG